MYQITVGVEGMACEMCDAHVNEAVRKAFDVKKVTSSHGKKQTVILSVTPLSEAEVRRTSDATGYQTTSLESAPYEKKGFFAKLFG